MSSRLSVLLATGVLLLAGCGTADQGPGATPPHLASPVPATTPGVGLSPSPNGDTPGTGVIRIGYAPASYDLTDFFGQLDTGIRQGLDDRGVSYEMILEPASALAAQDEQLANHENLLTFGVDYLISAPTVPEAMVPAYERANEMGVPVLIAQFLEPPEGVDILALAGVTHENAGEIAAQYIIDYLGGSGQVAILHGEAGSPVTQGRTLHAIPILEEGGVEVVAEEYADFERDIAFRLTEDIITRFPDVDFIYGGSSAMALGAMTALEDRELDIPVIGVGGTLEELQMVLEGRLQGTVLRDPVAMGDALAEAIHLHLEGREDEIDQVAELSHVMIDSCEDVVENASRVLFEAADVEWPEC